MSILTASDLATSNITPDPNIVTPSCLLSPANYIQMTPLQAARYFQLANKEVRDEDLAGDLILWKGFVSWHDGPAKRFVKMLVPAAATRRHMTYDEFGSKVSGWGNRQICAEYVDVISVFDAQGNAIDHVSSWMDRSVVYKAGTRVTPIEHPPFINSRSRGIWGFLTLIEAVNWGCNLSEAPPDLTALGL